MNAIFNIVGRAVVGGAIGYATGKLLEECAKRKLARERAEREYAAQLEAIKSETKRFDAHFEETMNTLKEASPEAFNELVKGFDERYAEIKAEVDNAFAKKDQEA